MTINYKKGDITTCTELLIAHGCNAQGKMASGVAKALREKFPSLTWDVYKKQYDINNSLEVGEVIIGECTDKVIFNCITQKFYGYDGKVYVDYDAIRSSFYFIDNWEWNEIDRITPYDLAIPKIGAGLAGGSWEVISSIIKDTVKNRNVIVYTL